MLDITVEVDTSDLDKKWRAAQAELWRHTGQAVDRACKEGAAEAKATHEYQDRTGNLSGSIGGGVTSAGMNGASGEIWALARYASAVEEGQPAHDISGNPMLNFWWEREQTQFVGPLVHHPGAPPKPFMGQAYTKAERVLEREMEEAAERAARIMNE